MHEDRSEEMENMVCAGVKGMRERGQESSIMDGSGVKEGRVLLRFIHLYWKVTSGRESGK